MINKENLKDYYQGKVELYAGMRGQHGIPDSIRVLLDDCQEAKDTLMEIANKINSALK